MIKNNSISADTEGERAERLTLLSANIGAVAAPDEQKQIGFSLPSV